MTPTSLQTCLEKLASAIYGQSESEVEKARKQLLYNLTRQLQKGVSHSNFLLEVCHDAVWEGIKLARRAEGLQGNMARDGEF